MFREVGRRTDKTAGGCDSIESIVAGNDQALAQKQFTRMTARKWHAVGDRHVRFCLLQTGGLYDLTLNPTAVGFTGDCLDGEADGSKAVVRIFVPRIGLDHRRLLKVSQQFVGARERAAILEI